MKRIIISLVVIIIFAGAGVLAYPIFFKKTQTAQNLVTVKRSTIVEEVVATGSTKSDQNIDLSFQKGGTVQTIAAKVGDHIKKDQILLELDASEAGSQLRQAQASAQSSRAQLLQYEATLESQQARLDELKRGTTKDDLALAQTKVDNAQRDVASAQDALRTTSDAADRALENAKQGIDNANISLKDSRSNADLALTNLYGGVKDILDDTYSKAYDAINTQTQPFFGNIINTVNPSLVLRTLDGQAKSSAENKRVDAYAALSEMEKTRNSATDEALSLDAALANFRNKLMIVRNSLSPLSDVLNSSIDSSTVLAANKTSLTTGINTTNSALAKINDRQQAIATQKQSNEKSVNDAQTKLTDAESVLESQKTTNAVNLTAAQAKVTDAKNALDIARNELTIKKSGTPDEQIRAQEALVKQAQANSVSQRAQIASAEANVEFYKTQVQKTRLISPIDGVVAAITPRIGETVSANSAVINLLSDLPLDIEVNIPEVDIAKIMINNPVRINVDALPGEEIMGRVMRIDPGETIVDGVVNFKVTIAFEKADPRIRSGFTANVAIQTARHENVLVIPQFSIQEADQHSTVKRYKNSATEDVTIMTGIRGTQNMVEVLSGLSEGDQIINIGLKSESTK